MPPAQSSNLALAGVGVASIVDAQARVTALGQTIASYQGRIAADTQNMTADQAQVRPIFVDEPGEIVVITVYLYYF